MTQTIIVFVLVAVAVVVVAIRIYNIFTNKHTCCSKNGGECHCQDCAFARDPSDHCPKNKKCPNTSNIG